jgi:hypothetical protein
MRINCFDALRAPSLAKKSTTIALLLAVAALVCGGRAQATTYDFQNVYYLSNSTPFSLAFPGASGSTGSSTTTRGYYEETTTSPITITKISGVSNVGGVFDVNAGLASGLALFGWQAATAVSGQPIGSVFNLNNPINGTNTYFQYKTGGTGGFLPNGGTVTAFTFNSFDLRGPFPTANLTFTLQGYLAGSLVDSVAINLLGNTFQTFTENWTNVDTIVIASTCDKTMHVCDQTIDPADFTGNFGSGSVYMDNIVINGPTAATPLPAALPLFATGLGALGLLGWRRRRKAAVVV